MKSYKLQIMKYSCYCLCLLFCSLSTLSFGQELDATVRVQAPNLGTSDKSAIALMEKSITEFLNTQKFTTDNFTAKERIKCNFQITIRQDGGNNNFVSDILVQGVRPVFNSSYETTLINLLNKEIPMRYDPFRPIENSKENYFDNLSSVLTYYAYAIIMMDYESFSLEGGETYCQLLQNMLNLMPATAKSIDKSWAGEKGKNNTRYDLIENILNPRMKPYRRGIYEYHRLGMDLLEKDVVQARRNILAALEAILTADKSYPNTYLIQVFCSTKASEIVEIFKKGTLDEKNKAFEIMISLDPSNASVYNAIKL